MSGPAVALTPFATTRCLEQIRVDVDPHAALAAFAAGQDGVEILLTAVTVHAACAQPVTARHAHEAGLDLWRRPERLGRERAQDRGGLAERGRSRRDPLLPLGLAVLHAAVAPALDPDPRRVDVRLPLTRLDGMRQAAVDVVLEQRQRNLVGRRGQGLDLLEHVEAVGLLVDQALDAARLPLDASETRDQVALVAGVAVAEMGLVRVSAHTGGQYVDDRPAARQLP